MTQYSHGKMRMGHPSHLTSVLPAGPSRDVVFNQYKVPLTKHVETEMEFVTLCNFISEVIEEMLHE